MVYSTALIKEISRITAFAKRILSQWTSSVRWHAYTHTMKIRQILGLYSHGKLSGKSGRKVVFWVPGGMPLMLHVEGAIAEALRLRGNEVHGVICDGPFRACVKREVTDKVPIDRWKDECSQCKTKTSAVLDRMRIPYSFVGDYVSESVRAALWEMTKGVTWETLDDLNYGNINVGKNARSSILRYLKGHDLAGHEGVVREYAFSALVSAAAAASAMDRLSPSHIFTSHCFYVDWGPGLHMAISRKIPVTAWKGSYLSWRFYFRPIKDNPRIAIHNLSDNAWEECGRRSLSSDQDACLDWFLENRYKKHISFDMMDLKTYTGKPGHLRERFSLVSTKPVWGIMAHLNWDAVSDSSPMAYESFDVWMLDTIRTISNISEVQWLIKVHPSEAWHNHPSSPGLQQLIEKHFPSLPLHIKVVSAEEEINPLDFLELVDGGVTAYGTSGLEIALLGKPVILAGEAHYGGKGFTYDGLTPERYRQYLHQTVSLSTLNKDQRQLARRYAYNYFIQRQVPFPVVRNPKSSWWSFQYDKRHLLLPGKDPFTDFICERIIDGRDFIMDETLVKLSEKGW